MRISVYGCGLSGLVTAWAMANTGNEVRVLTCEGESADAISHGWLPVVEPGLEKLIREEVESGRLTFHEQAKEVFEHGRLHFFNLPADALEQTEELLKELALSIQSELVIVNQSTYPVGTSRRWKLELTLLREKHGLLPEVYPLAFPSFLQEGAAVQNFTRPKRILVGADDEWGLGVLKEALRPFNRNRDQLMVMSTKAAEFTKYAINGMLATKLSFMNEMANLADQLGVDIEQVRQGVGSDPRVGFDYIYPGCGYGGLSFSEDVMSLAKTVEANVEDSFLLRTVLDTNEQQKEVLFRKVWRYWEADLKGKTLALWGAAFKPNTDRIDNAPSVTLMEALWSQGAKVRLYDPQAMEQVAARYGDRDDLELTESPYAAVEGADALLIVTEWKAFWNPDFDRLGNLLKQKLIFDGRNIYDPDYMKTLGFTYFGIGRSNTRLV